VNGSMSDPGVTIEIRSDVGHINLRGNPENPGFVKAAEAALGQPLPVDANTITDAGHRVFWLGPDEWLVMTASGNTAELLQRLKDALAKYHASVNDISGGNITLSLSGGRVRDLLAKGCTLDLHADVFKAGACAQSGLAKAGVLIGRVDDSDTFDLIIRRSFADYLMRWLRRAGSEFGIEFR